MTFVTFCLGYLAGGFVTGAVLIAAMLRVEP